jgi:hypothetical protein
MPTKPCSDDCALILDPCDLRRVLASQTDDDLSTSFVRFGKDQIMVLKEILAGRTFGAEYTYCDAAGAISDASCRDVREIERPSARLRC